MPTPRKFSNYPDHYPELFLEAYHEPMKLLCSSPAKCKVLRAYLYGFRASALDELTNLLTQGKLSEEQILLRKLLPRARFRIEKSTLVIYYSEFDKDISHAINNRLKQTDIPVKD